MSLFLKMAVCLVVVLMVSSAHEARAQRAMYWNLPETGTAAIELIKSFGVDEVHIFLNDNVPPKECGKYDWKMSKDKDGNSAIYWPPKTLRAFIRELQDAKIKPVLTLSPWFQTHEFIDSLATSDGPFHIAHGFGDLPVEFDLEGNWTEGWRIHHLGGCITINTEAATDAMLAALRRVSPKSSITVSTTNEHMAQHKRLIEKASIVSPQMYGEYFADHPQDIKTNLDAFVRAYPRKIIRPAFSIECSPSDAVGNCSEKRFLNGLTSATQSSLCTPGSSISYVVWALNESRLPSGKVCGGEGVCSTFGRAFLRRTAANPTLKCPLPPGTPSRDHR